MNIWNVRELPLPPITTYKTKNKDIDIKYLNQICQEIKDFFDNNKYLHTEHFLLSRLIYRMKTKFRSAKDMKAVEKVNRAVDIFLNVNISSNLSIFISLIPSKYKSDTYLPSKNLLDYILVRLQGVAKLLERIVESCKISAHLLNERMHIGHFWILAFMLFSLVSRIYVLAKFTTNRICEFYGKLLPYSGKLLNVSKDFLPKGYELPMNLKEWINLEWTEYEEMQYLEEPSNIPDIIDYFDLIHDDSDVEFCNEYILLEDSDDDKVEIVDEHEDQDIFSNHKYIQGTNDSEDVEVISVKQKDNISGSKYVNDSSSKEFRGFQKIEDVGEIIYLNNSKQCDDESSKVLDSSSDSIIEETVEIGKNSIDDSTLLLSDKSIIELPLLNRTKPRKSKKIIRTLNYNKDFDSRADNPVGKSYFMEDISRKDQSKCIQNKLVLKRHAELDLNRKIKRRKLSSLDKFPKSRDKKNVEIREESKGPSILELNRSELMKRKSNKSSQYKKSNNPHYQLNLDLNSKTNISSKSINENQSLKRKVKSRKTVLVELNKSTKRISHKNKITVNKKKHNNTNQLNVDINSSKPSFSSKDLEAKDTRKSNKKDKKKMRVVQSPHSVTEPDKFSEVLQIKPCNLSNKKKIKKKRKEMKKRNVK